MDDLRLQLLQPETDADLYREAWGWRRPKTHISAEQMSFETFAENNPTHLAVGLFNGELIAVYFFVEWAQLRYEAHLTSKKGTPREIVLMGAQAALNGLMEYASEVSAFVRPRNRALRQFVTDLGMVKVGQNLFTCVNDLNNVILTQRNQRKVYVKYVKMKDETPVGPFRQEASFQSNPIGAE